MPTFPPKHPQHPHTPPTLRLDITASRTHSCPDTAPAPRQDKNWLDIVGPHGFLATFASQLFENLEGAGSQAVGPAEALPHARRHLMMMQ